MEPWEELCFSYYGDIEVSDVDVIFDCAETRSQEKREEIEAERKKAGEDVRVREHAVYALCRCEADNCIGRLFS